MLLGAILVITTTKASAVSTGIQDTCTNIASDVQLLGGIKSWGSGITITGAQALYTGIRSVFDGNSNLGGCQCELFYDDSIGNEDERYSVNVECGKNGITPEVVEPGAINIKTLRVNDYMSPLLTMALEYTIARTQVVFSESTLGTLVLRHKEQERRRRDGSNPTPAPAVATIYIIAPTVCTIMYTNDVNFTLNSAPSNASCLFNCSSALSQCECGYGLVLDTFVDNSATPPTTTVMCRSNDTQSITFNEDTYTLCNGSSATVTWGGSHNIMEMDGDACNSNDVGYIHQNYANAGYNETFINLGAAPGTTRHFKCETHCASGGKFATTCPELPILAPPSTVPPITTTTTTEATTATTTSAVDIIITTTAATDASTTATPAGVPTIRPTYARRPQTSGGTGEKSDDGDDLTVGLIAASCGLVVLLTGATFYKRHKDRLLVNANSKHIVVTKVKGLVF